MGSKLGTDGDRYGWDVENPANSLRIAGEFLELEIQVLEGASVEFASRIEVLITECR
ncbi:hypothetical protein [Nocardia sp. NPDC047654]|uniref:hypothetical protein n=1 Tax=Nocardia sp. NPDC047654 TaxID=3364314 RepID=UPI003722CCCA